MLLNKAEVDGFSLPYCYLSKKVFPIVVILIDTFGHYNCYYFI